MGPVYLLSLETWLVLLVPMPLVLALSMISYFARDRDKRP